MRGPRTPPPSEHWLSTRTAREAIASTSGRGGGVARSTRSQRAVPLGGRVLEVGCGHGLLSAYLALSSPGREVTGVDIDEHKIALADDGSPSSRGRRGPVVVRDRATRRVAEGLWDTIVVADVLYLLDPPSKRSLLRAMVEHLAPGGAIIVKETDVLPRWKFNVNRMQEYAATHVLRITQGETLDYEPAGALAAFLESLGMTARVESIDRGYPHPHVLIAAARPQSTTGAPMDASESRLPSRRRSGRDRAAELGRQARGVAAHRATARTTPW